MHLVAHESLATQARHFLDAEHVPLYLHANILSALDALGRAARGEAAAQLARCGCGRAADIAVGRVRARLRCAALYRSWISSLTQWRALNSTELPSLELCATRAGRVARTIRRTHRFVFSSVRLNRPSVMPCWCSNVQL